MTDPGQTTDPKTGKLYRKQPPKERSAEFLRLRKAAEDARIALVTYCNNKSYTYDIKAGKVFEPYEKDGKSQSRWVKDPGMDRLVSSLKSAKSALQQYKTAHPGEFQEQAPGKKARGPTTMQVVNKPSEDG